MDKKNVIKDHPLGMVKEIKDNKVIVVFGRSSACGKCEACGMLKETGEMYLDFELEDQVEVGEHVGVYVDEGFFLLSAFLLYGIPLFVLLLGIGVASIFFNEGNQQLIAAGIGFVLCVASYFVLRKFDGYFEKIKRKYMKYTKL